MTIVPPTHLLHAQMWERNGGLRLKIVNFLNYSIEVIIFKLTTISLLAVFPRKQSWYSPSSTMAVYIEKNASQRVRKKSFDLGEF